MRDKIKRINITDKVLIIILILATIFRIWLAIKIPLYAQAGADFDDFLYTKYAVSHIKGDWLGEFEVKTLAKGASFSIFIAATYLSGIPYSVALISVYILASIIFIIAIRKYINNKWFLCILYLMLLFSPVMFHIENTQKIYRGGLIVAFSLLTIGSIIGLFGTKNGSRKDALKWSLLSGFSLSFFWFIKEDSIWIMPFVLGVIGSIIIYYIIKRKTIKNIISRSIIVTLPIIILLLSNITYCTINYLKYGEYTVTDRNGTYFKNVINDLLLIKDEKKDNIWITKNMMYKAIEVSPTLKTIEKEIDNMYVNSWALVDGGEIEGDIIFWIIKETVNDAGVYSNGGKYVNDFYKKIHEELKTAFEEGKLEKNEAIYLSPVANGFKLNEFKYFYDTTKEAIPMLITYDRNETSVNVATGDLNKIILMQNLANSYVILPNTDESLLKPFYYVVSIANIIVNIYQKTGVLVFGLGILGLIVLVIRTIIELARKNYKNLEISLIVLYLIATAFVLLFGVEWFCNAFGNSSILGHIYNYTCGIIPIMQILEIIGIYYLCQSIYMIATHKKNKTTEVKTLEDSYNKNEKIESTSNS